MPGCDGCWVISPEAQASGLGLKFLLRLNIILHAASRTLEILPIKALRYSSDCDTAQSHHPFTGPEPAGATMATGRLRRDRKRCNCLKPQRSGRVLV